MNIARYPSSITDAQWALIKPMLSEPKKRGRPPTDRRQIIDAIFYVLMGGIQWRMLPSSFPPWQTVYHVFGQWSQDHTLEWLNARLRARVRGSEGKRSRPTAAILDSQSVKSDAHGGQVGYDAGKRIKGRKRHLLVDTLGMLLEVWVSPASTGDRSGAKKLLEGALGGPGVLSWLRKLWVDRGYSGKGFADWVKERQAKLEVEVVKPRGEARGFQVQAHRWKVERTIGWLMQSRRMVRDYEKTETSAKAWVYLRMIDLQIRRLA